MPHPRYSFAREGDSGACQWQVHKYRKTSNHQQQQPQRKKLSKFTTNNTKQHHVARFKQPNDCVHLSYAHAQTFSRKWAWQIRGLPCHVNTITPPTFPLSVHRPLLHLASYLWEWPMITRLFRSFFFVGRAIAIRGAVATPGREG